MPHQWCLLFWRLEERAFWTLVCAFDALGVEGYYTDRMVLLRADMQVLQAFMKMKCPKVAKACGWFSFFGCLQKETRLLSEQNGFVNGSKI